MSDAPINLNEARAVKACDNKLWTPLDCARAVVRDLESGELRATRLVVIYTEPEADGGWTVGSYRANLDVPDHIALLNVELQRTIKRWQVI